MKASREEDKKKLGKGQNEDEDADYFEKLKNSQ